MPAIEVQKDYEGFFERVLRAALKQYEPDHIKKIILTSGPYRSYDVMYSCADKKLALQGIVVVDFYSAGRMSIGMHPYVQHTIDALRECDDKLNDMEKERDGRNTTIAK